MQQLILSAAFLTLSLYLSGQNIREYVSTLAYGRFQALALAEDGGLIAAGSYKSCPEIYLAYFGPDGTLAWENPLAVALAPATDVFFDRGQRIVVAGSASEVEDGG